MNKTARLLTIGMLWADVARSAEPRHPNIVYIIADQWREMAFGFAGDPNVKTPNLDRLAKEGLYFRNAVSVCPVCTPHRAALMTGRYPTSTGMFLNDLALPTNALCMGDIFKADGYTTGYIGKWHLDGHGRESYIPPDRRHGWEYWKGAECDHTYNHSHYYTDDSDQIQYWEGYDAFAQTKDAQQYVRDHAQGSQPFILVLSYGEPHFPHGTAPAEYRALYPAEKIKLPPNVPQAMQARARREAQGYYAHCTALDKCIGDLLDTLKEAGAESNTIVVFSADHGEMMGSHGCPPTMKQVPWNESARVPFLLRYPADSEGTAGRVVSTPLTTPVILPTLLGLAKESVPKTVEGENLSRLIRDGHEEKNRAVLYMAVAPFGPPEFLKEYRAIRTSQFTYIRSLDGPWLMFDDDADPYQMDNLIGKPEFHAQQAKLDAQLQAALKKIGDNFQPASHYIARWGYDVKPFGSIPYNAGAKVQSPKLQTAAK